MGREADTGCAVTPHALFPPLAGQPMCQRRKQGCTLGEGRGKAGEKGRRPVREEEEGRELVIKAPAQAALGKACLPRGDKALSGASGDRGETR